MSPNMPREQKAILFGEFQVSLDKSLEAMHSDATGVRKNQLCAFLGNFFVRVTPQSYDPYDLQVRKTKLRDLVILRISEMQSPQGKPNECRWTKSKPTRGCR